MTITSDAISTTDLEQLLADGRHELIAGALIEISPVGGIHGSVAARLIIRLGVWAEQHAGGVVGTESGFRLIVDPPTVRGPDVYYIRAEHIPPSGIPRGFWDQAPDLAVEIISPSESAHDVRAKVHDYRSAGTPLIWEIYPQLRLVVVHAPDGTARTLTAADTLEYPELLPGFRCTVAELFS